MAKLDRNQVLKSLLRAIATGSGYNVENLELIDSTLQEEDYPTLSTLGKLLGFDRDDLKRGLTTLKDLEIIRVMGFNPKHYRFDAYQFQNLKTRHDLDLEGAEANAIWSAFEDN